MNSGDNMAWRETLAHYDSNLLRELKLLIDQIIADREEFFR